jgi:hypothetical protein
MFRQVRKLFLEGGGSFVTSSEQLHDDYVTCALLTLPGIMADGRVPVFDNCAFLQRLLKANPLASISKDFFFATFRRNVLLHEAAHCVAYRVLSPLIGETINRDKRWYVIICLFCEAYANSVERLAALMADCDLHRCLFRINSYIDAKPSRISECLKVLDVRHILLIGMLIFARLNRQCSWSQENLHQLVMTSLPEGSTDGQIVLMELVAERLSNTLEATFITVTNPVFFRHVACEREYRDLCSGRMALEALKRPEFLEKIDNLITMTCEGSLRPGSSVITGIQARQLRLSLL